VVAELADAVAAHGSARIAVDGRTAAGKTTLADELADRLRSSDVRVIRICLDDFHRPEEVRYARGRDSPEGYYRDSFDLDALRDAVACAAGGDVVVLVDGVFLLRPELVDLWELSIWVEIDEAESLLRGVARDALRMGGEDAARARYEARYLRGETLYVAEARPRERADVVVDNTDPSCPRLL
jgi:uridine kinase